MSKPRNSNYPTLSDMGVSSPLQIDRYYITSINAIDHLRIVYDRPEDSMLTSSRSYRFPRVQKDGDSKLSMHPRLKDALAELESIMESKATKENIVAEILNEIALLEEDIALRSECLKVLVKRIPAVD